MQISKQELIKKKGIKTFRYPNLNTVLLVEDFLKEHQDTPMKLSDIKKGLGNRIMHQTLKIILEFVWKGGKILYGPKGIQWIFKEPSYLKKMVEGALEI